MLAKINLSRTYSMCVSVVVLHQYKMFFWINIAAEHNVQKSQQQFHNTVTVLLTALFTQLLGLFLAYFIFECILADEGCVYTKTEPMMKTQYFPLVIDETPKVERWSSTQLATLVEDISAVSLPKHNILLVTFTTDSEFKKKRKRKEFLWILYKRQSVIWLPSKIV